MNAITQFLLANAALVGLATAPAAAGGVLPFHVTALHAGHAVNKTKVRDPSRVHVTYTYAIYTSVPASDFRIKTNLMGTYYRWNSLTSGGYFTTCSSPKMRIKGPKKSIYGRITHNTESYSVGCPSGPMVFYGDAYTLMKVSGEGKTDSFVSSLIGKFRGYGTKYRGTLNLDVSVAIGE